ncbi:UDP-N-acetylglucosamine 1-carboxyvinyltransferase [bacterium]|jgi:UDP-N-acetylglucosamine 1-carboxyvinyltransferase|nr:UDP-N-acetylglucosamine 1-carboxyvinyltransferase [bacterium]MDA7866854.1 UDP-N-acetylglucosamine 1-carboxyvinyltransferase [Verrucomicrobiota bacterium]
MDSLLIEGGCTLRGEVTISGAKNAVLPIMAAALLTEERCVIRNAPNLSDVRFMGQILESLGAEVEFDGDTIVIHSKEIHGRGDYDLIRKMRGSVCILGPLLGRLGVAEVSLPGGCVIGSRPIDLHLKGMEALGGEAQIRAGYVIVKTDRLRGSQVFLGGRVGPTVLGTANVMMAGVLAEGRTVIESAACEPEVVDLANFLIGMGAKIQGAGSPTITIDGVEKLGGVDHEVIPDRIEAATFAIAAAATRGDVLIHGARCEHLGAVLDKLSDAGVPFTRGDNSLHVAGAGVPKPVDVTTQPFAGFPTDVQAQMMALMTLTEGISVITERIFESRFMHVSELARLGAEIAIEGGATAIVKGGRPLSGAPVMASDLRASAALVIAGLVADGETNVKRIYHLDRGYERIDQKLEKLGGRVRRIQES